MNLVTLNSGWASKINWLEMFKIVAAIATVFGITVPPDLIPAALAAITAIGGLVTIVVRTWFTGKPA